MEKSAAQMINRTRQKSVECGKEKKEEKMSETHCDKYIIIMFRPAHYYI